MNISNCFHTNRLIIQKAELNDTENMNRICASWKEKALLEGDDFSKDYIENCIVNGDLPPIPNAIQSNYYMMTIKNNDGQMIGFFDLYLGYPDDRTLWIGMFLIDKSFQGYRYGNEVITSICQICRESEYKVIALGVYLKNWKGLRFWNNNGFNQILGIYGDKEYSTTSHSLIVLKKEL